MFRAGQSSKHVALVAIRLTKDEYQPNEACPYPNQFIQANFCKLMTVVSLKAVASQLMSVSTTE